MMEWENNLQKNIKISVINVYVFEIIINLLFFIMGLIVGRLKKVFKFFNPASKFLSEFSEETIIVVPNYNGYEEESLRKGYGDYNAASSIQSAIKKFNNNAKIIDERFAEPKLAENIILVGGPITNQLTREILKFFPYNFEGHSIVKTDGTIRIEPSKNSKEDCGMLIMANNPKNKNKKIVIAAGCYGYGTLIVSEAISDPNYAKIIKKFLKNNNIKGDFMIILRGKIENNKVKDIKIIYGEKIEYEN